MIEIKHKDSNLFKSIFLMLDGLFDDVELHITEKAIEFSQMDSSHACLGKFLLDKDDFEIFPKKEKKKIDYRIAISVNTLIKVLKCAETSDELTLKIDESDLKKITFVLKNKNKKNPRKHNVDAIEDYEAENIDISEIEKFAYENSAKMKTDLFASALKEAEIYDEYICLKVQEVAKEMEFAFSASGSIGDTEYNVDKDDLKESKLVKPTANLYFINFLKKILKASAFSNEMDIAFGVIELDDGEGEKKVDATPLRVNFSNGNSKITFFIAPKVTEEEDYTETSEENGDDQEDIETVDDDVDLVEDEDDDEDDDDI